MSQSIAARHFRALQESDLDAIVRIENRAYAFPWTRGMFRDCLRAGYLAQVVEVDNDIIGYAVASVAVGEAHLLNVSIQPVHQAKGNGKALLMSVFDASRQLGAKRMFLEVRASNQPAIALYHKMGFNEIDQRRNYYPAINGREDALVMALEFAVCSDPAV